MILFLDQPFTPRRGHHLLRCRRLAEENDEGNAEPDTSYLMRRRPGSGPVHIPDEADCGRRTDVSDSDMESIASTLKSQNRGIRCKPINDLLMRDFSDHEVRNKIIGLI